MRIEPPRRAPEEEQKLAVLCCLEKLGPCSELQLLQFLFEHDLMNYFEMMFALNELCDRGQAVRARKPAGYSYEVTEAGREALQLFGGRVPRSLQTLLAEKGEAWRARFRREAQSVHRIDPTGRGDYALTLKVVEQDAEMMKLTLALPTRDLARRLGEDWPRKAPRLYEAVIRILSEEET